MFADLPAAMLCMLMVALVRHEDESPATSARYLTASRVNWDVRAAETVYVFVDDAARALDATQVFARGLLWFF